MGFLNTEQLWALGLKKVGGNVLISDKASFYNAGNISIGDNVRIDDFCILSAGDGGIEIGSYIHIACYASIRGAEKVTLQNYSNVAAYSSILSSNDDYRGGFFIGPTIPDEFRNVTTGPVLLKEHALLGQYCFVLPGVTVGENACVGAFSLVKKNVPDNCLYGGIPAKHISQRKDRPWMDLLIKA